jgi:hypothetical protein
LEQVKYNDAVEESIMSANESKTGTPNHPAATKRRRLSLASWLCGFVVLCLWVLVAVPGLPREELESMGEVVVSRDFGWPTVHCTTTEWDFPKEKCKRTVKCV